jgi:hypothetical protein
MGAVGLATGLAVRIGQELSSNLQRAKSIAAWCMGFAIVVGSVVATLLFWLRGYIVRIFTNDEQVIQVLAINEFHYEMGIVRSNLTHDSSFIGMHGHLGSSLCLCLYSVYIFHQSCDSTGTWNAMANRCLCCNLSLVWCPTHHYLYGNLLERGTQCHLDYFAYGICNNATGVDTILYSNGLERGL